MVVVKPHSSGGKVRAYTLNFSQEEIFAELELNREDDGATGVLTLESGERHQIQWSEITFMRDLRGDEK